MLTISCGVSKIFFVNDTLIAVFMQKFLFDTLRIIKMASNGVFVTEFVCTTENDDNHQTKSAWYPYKG